MKKTAIALAVFASFASPSMAADFVNGGFEDGNLGGWTGGGGCWGTTCAGGVSVPLNTALPLPTAAAYVGGVPNNTLMTGGVDPITGLTRVYNGANSVRVNDSINNYSVSTISQSVINYTNNFIYFEWQAVLEASHDLDDSDYFSIVLRDDTTGLDVVTRSYSSAGAIGAGVGSVVFTTAANNSSWFTSGWVVEAIDLTTAGAGGSNIVGNNFTLSLLAADCPYSGHAGYVYLDGFGGTIVTPGPNGVPEPASLALLGLGLAGLAASRRRKSA